MTPLRETINHVIFLHHSTSTEEQLAQCLEAALAPMVPTITLSSVVKVIPQIQVTERPDDWPNSQGRVVDAAGNAITSDPASRATSAHEAAAAWEILGFLFPGPWHGDEENSAAGHKGETEEKTEAILARHFPVQPNDKP